MLNNVHPVMVDMYPIKSYLCNLAPHANIRYNNNSEYCLAMVKNQYNEIFVLVGWNYKTRVSELFSCVWGKTFNAPHALQQSLKILPAAYTGLL